MQDLAGGADFETFTELLQQLYQHRVTCISNLCRTGSLQLGLWVLKLAQEEALVKACQLPALQLAYTEVFWSQEPQKNRRKRPSGGQS